MTIHTKEEGEELKRKYRNTTKSTAPKPLDGNKPLWHKQKGESIEAYSAFMAYLLLPPEERTYGKAAHQVGKSMQLMRQWGARWSWRMRSGAYEEHYLLLRLESIEADRDQMWREQKLLADTALAVVDASLRDLLEQIDPNTGTLKGLKGDQLVRMLAEAAKIQRLAVIGRSKDIEKIKEKNETLMDNHAEELAQTLQQFMNRVALTAEQQRNAKTVLNEILLGETASVN